MSGEERGALLVGLPGAGKSTYLGLLYLAILEKQRCSLELADHNDDREHANRLMQALLRCEVAVRTEVAQSDGLNLSVRHSSGEEASLVMPDLSGETWQEVVHTSTMDRALFEQLNSASCVAIFVHVGSFESDPLISEVNAAAAALGNLDEAPESSTETDSINQINITALIQGIDELVSNDCRVSIVLSAFDLAGTSTPSEWLGANAPLVDQYIASSARSIELFGLSAQGGDFEAARESLLAMDGLERASVLDREGKDVDVDAPISGLWVDG